jgi:hypothetical protein
MSIVENRSISLSELFDSWQLSDKYEAWYLGFKKHYAILQELKSRPDLSASAAEIQSKWDVFIRKHQIQDLDPWLKQRNLKREDLEKKWDYQVRLAKLKHGVVESRIHEHFLQNRAKFDLVELSRIVLDSQDLAEEIYDSIAAQDSTFEREATEYSLNKHKIKDEFHVVQPLLSVPPPIRAELGESKSGAVLPPVLCDNNLWYIVRLERYFTASLNDETIRKRIEIEVFDSWVLEKANSFNLSIVDTYEFNSI